MSDALKEARHALETRAAELELVGELERRMDAALSALAGDWLGDDVPSDKLGFHKGLLVHDPDGHAMELVQP